MWISELLRGVANGGEEGADGTESRLHLRGFGVLARKGNGGLRSGLQGHKFVAALSGLFVESGLNPFFAHRIALGP